MIYEITPQILIVLSLAGIIVILGRKINVVGELPISSATEEGLKRTKRISTQSFGLVAKASGSFLFNGLKKFPHYLKIILISLGRAIAKTASFIMKRRKLISEKIEARKSEKAIVQPEEVEEKAEEKNEEAFSVTFTKEEHKDPAPKPSANTFYIKERPIVDANQDLLTQARYFAKIKNFTEAENLCIEFIKDNPKNCEVYKILGEIYFHQGNFEDARKSFQYALKKGIADDDVYQKLGLAYTEEGKTGEAIKIYERALKNTTHKECFYKELVRIYRAAGENKKASEVYEKLMAESRDS